MARKCRDFSPISPHIPIFQFPPNFVPQPKIYPRAYPYLLYFQKIDGAMVIRPCRDWSFNPVHFGLLLSCCFLSMHSVLTDCSGSSAPSAVFRQKLP